MIALIDYGAGNLTSVRKALAAVKAEVFTPAAPADLERHRGIVIPGVGHFAATRAIDAAWRAAILAAVERQRPDPRHLPGPAVSLRRQRRGAGRSRAGVAQGPLPSPAADREGPARRLECALNERNGRRCSTASGTTTQVYFTHSYAPPITRAAVATTEHGVRFASAVEQGRVYGVQFHPEKSGDAGLHDPPLLCTDFQISKFPNFQMVAKRLIACLDVRDGCVVKGVRFEGLANAGDPAALARRYNAEGIDELVILDVTATLEKRRALEETLRRVSAELFIPLAVGGGIHSEADAAAALDAGADKVALNTAALENPALLTRLAARYGSQAVVAAIDAKHAGSSLRGLLAERNHRDRP